MGEAIRVPRHEIRNKNNASVSTDNFLNPAFAWLSAGSFKRDLIGENLELALVHNPLATNPLPHKIFGADREYVVEIDEGSFTLRRT